jgi:hypothetical protein
MSTQKAVSRSAQSKNKKPSRPPDFAPTNAPLAPAKPLSKKELGQWLHCSPKFLEGEVNAGRLRALKLSNRMIRFNWSDIQAWLQSKSV